MRILRIAIPIMLVACFTLNAHAGRMFKQMDTDEDGRVTEKEFLNRWESFFKRLDKNGDGVLQEKEWKAPGPAWDRDGNGVTLEEWMTLRKRHFKTSDKDGDGALAPEELPK